MLSYYMPFYDGSVYYSVDNVRLDFKFISLDQFDWFLKNVNKLDGFVYFSSFRDFGYRHLFTFGAKGLSFTLGLGFNGQKLSDSQKGFLDFNPNKVLGDIVFGNGFIKAKSNPFGDKDDMCINEYALMLQNVFKEVLRLLSLSVKTMSVKRWDLAVDVPVKRSDVQLFKDRRKYAQFYLSSEDFTEYLGQSDSAGRVKVYNKTLESQLDYDLTRVEVTMDSFGYSDLLHWWPEVYKTNVIPLASDKLVVALFREIPVDRRDFYLRQISDRRTKGKYKALLTSERFEVPEVAFLHLVRILQQWER